MEEVNIRVIMAKERMKLKIKPQKLRNLNNIEKTD
jgi:hypothetical protein